MIFQIRNESGNTINLDGVSYRTGMYVPIVKYIGFGSIQCTKNDIDGSNAGRGINGRMIRDYIATKLKWEVSLLGAIKAEEAQEILKLMDPANSTKTFHIQTDYPTGRTKEYEVYTNNIPISFAIRQPNGQEYYTGISFPIVEV